MRKATQRLANREKKKGNLQSNFPLSLKTAI